MFLKKVFIILIISIIFMSVNIVYANTSNNIVSISSDKIALNSDFYLILNLSNINYTKFKVEITNESSLKSTDISNGVTNVSNNEGNVSFIVDKSSINLDKLAIVYTSTSMSSKINFNVVITNLDNSLSELQKELDVLNQEISTLNSNLEILKNNINNLEEGTPEYEEINNQIKTIQESIINKTNEKETLEGKISNYEDEKISEVISVEVTDEINQNENINLDDKNSLDKSPWGDRDSIMKDRLMEDDEELDNSMKDMMSKMSGLEQSLENANITNSSLTENNVYQGSQNNYLSSLSIEGIELKNEFKKTTLNYFAEVGSDVTSVTINAVPEDSNSVVTVYGNTDLQSGKNKIIISVTSEDGSVRNYKIYITK